MDNLDSVDGTNRRRYASAVFLCAQCRHSPKPALSRRRAVRIELECNDMMKAARKQGMSKVDAQAWVYAELDRPHPPQKADIVRSAGN